MKKLLITLLFISNCIWAADAQVEMKKTLFNIAVHVEKSLDAFSMTCAKREIIKSAKRFHQLPTPFPMPINTPSSSNQKRFDSSPIHSPFPMPIISPNKSQQKRLFNEKPFFTNPSQQCDWERSMIADRLIQKIERELENTKLNRSELSEAVEFVFQISENMKNEQDKEVLRMILSTKRLYVGLELLDLIIQNQQVPPTHLFKINNFVNSFLLD